MGFGSKYYPNPERDYVTMMRGRFEANGDLVHASCLWLELERPAMTDDTLQLRKRRRAG
jgi:hypothetical protein